VGEHPWRPVGVRALAVSLITAVLVACGGGGGGGGGGSSSSFNTAEFQANYALGKVNALTAYNNNGTGAGVTVAVVDTGIDQNHTEFSGRISGSSASVVGGTVQDTNGHGTQVAGQIAANRNSTGMHGIAFSATILAIKAGTSTTFLDNDIAAAIDLARTNNARVINLSLGGTGGVNATLQTALQNAVNAGIIIVASSGNSFSAQSEFPARLANCTGGGGVCNGFNAQGRMIAVGAVDSNNAEASFNSRADDTATAYLVAPGVSVLTTQLGGGTTTVSGTSFSSPLVAGAVAIILQRFPTLTTVQAVNLLFTSATDLGAAGTDTIFGRGLLNLQGAFNAQGLSSLPTGSTNTGSSVPVGDSQVKLGSAFGNALASHAFLGAVIALDGFQRPYLLDLRGRVEGSSPDLGLRGFLAVPSTRTVTTTAPGGLQFSAQVGETPANDLLRERAYRFGADGRQNPERDEKVEAVWLSAPLGERAQMAFASNHAPAAIMSDVLGLSAREGAPGSEFWFAPQLSLLDRGDGIAAYGWLGANWRFGFGVMSSERDELTGTGGGSLSQVAVGYRAWPNAELGLAYGQVVEPDSMFRSNSSGAFGSIGGADSRFATFSLDLTLDAKTSLQSSWSEVRMAPEPGTTGYLSNWGDVRANSFALGLTRRDAWRAGDRLSLTLGQPLRVTDAKADATLPVAADALGHIYYETRRIDVVPTGREIDLQVAYQIPLADRLNLSSFATIAREPGHDPAASVGFATGVRVNLKF